MPAEWPLNMSAVYCGYGGGLGPDNLAAQLPQIQRAAGGADFWVDMETKVRGDRNGRDVFDLDTARRCLEIAAEFRDHSTVAPPRGDRHAAR